MLSKREILGFALAPLPLIAPLLLMFAVVVFSAPTDRSSAVNAAFQLLVMAYGATFVIGVPVHLALRYRCRNSLAAYLGLTVSVIITICGVLALTERVLPPSVDDNPFRFQMWSRTGLTMMLALASAAALSAYVFWRVAVRLHKP